MDFLRLLTSTPIQSDSVFQLADPCLTEELNFGPSDEHEEPEPDFREEITKEHVSLLRFTYFIGVIQVIDMVQSFLLNFLAELFAPQNSSQNKTIIVRQVLDFIFKNEPV